MSLKEALSQIKQSDLDDINNEIESVEKNLAELKELRKVIEIKLGFQKPRGKGNWGGARRKKTTEDPAPPKPEGPKGPLDPSWVHRQPLTGGIALGQAGGGITDTYRGKCKEYLMANGPTKVPRLATMCDIPYGSMNAVLKHRWFKSGPNGVELSDAAYAEKGG